MGWKYTLSYKLGTKIVDEVGTNSKWGLVMLILSYEPKEDYAWMAIEIRH